MQYTYTTPEVQIQVMNDESLQIDSNIKRNNLLSQYF